MVAAVYWWMVSTLSVVNLTFMLVLRFQNRWRDPGIYFIAAVAYSVTLWASLSALFQILVLGESIEIGFSAFVGLLVVGVTGLLYAYNPLVLAWDILSLLLLFLSLFLFRGPVGAAGREGSALRGASGFMANTPIYVKTHEKGRQPYRERFSLAGSRAGPRGGESPVRGAAMNKAQVRR